MAQTVSSGAIALPPSFKAKTTLILLGVTLFFIIYSLFLISFVWLLLISLRTTLPLLVEGFSIWGILLFIGINGFLGLIVYFLIKVFIPDEKPEEKEIAIELKPQDEPELFKLIYEVADEVRTYRPQKVFLTHDNNASVFHEKSLLSLFNPSHQNLNIGLGLMGILSQTELKSVLAHEFGHFSQNITRLSSFNYRVNKLITDLLYSDVGWENTVSTGSQAHFVLAIFGGITLGTAKIIRFIFQKIYELVNLQYRSLSRDLEFHADTVAVQITGTNALKNALWKLDIGNIAYSTTTDYMNQYLTDDVKFTNLFTVYSWCLKDIAEKNEVPIENEMPVIKESFKKNLITSRIYFKDQWASHPSTAEREANMDATGKPRQYSDLFAWDLLTDVSDLQKKITHLIYEIAETDIAKLKETDTPTILEKIKQEQGQLNLNPAYNNFYYSRVTDIDIEKALEEYDYNVASTIRFDDIYTKEHRLKIDRLEQNKTDKEILTAIQEKTLKLSSFEFDNKKYKRKDSKYLLMWLDEEIEKQSAWLKEIDKKAFWWGLYTVEKNHPEKREDYINTYSVYIKSSRFLAIINEFFNYLNVQIGNYGKLVDDDESLKNYLRNIRNNEGRLKQELSKFNLANFIDSIDDDDVKKTADNYFNNNDVYYFSLTSIGEEQIANCFGFLMSLSHKAANYQLKLLKKATDMPMVFM